MVRTTNLSQLDPPQGVEKVPARSGELLSSGIYMYDRQKLCVMLSHKMISLVADLVLLGYVISAATCSQVDPISVSPTLATVIPTPHIIIRATKNTFI